MLEITARAHGLIHLFDPDYEPLTLQEYKDYVDASAWFYMVLKKCVKTTTGENVIKKHIYDYNIPKVLAALAADARTSTHAVVNLRQLFLKIATMRCDANYRGTLMSFLNLFKTRVRDYNLHIIVAQQITEVMAKVHLRSAVAPCKPLNEVQIRESERIVLGEPEYRYEEYLQLLEHQATLVDARNAEKRAANSHLLEWSDPESEGKEEAIDVNQALSEYIIQTAASKQGVRMSRGTWRSLTPDAQKVWDQLDDDSKALILSNSQAKKGRAKRNVQANMTIQELTEEQDEETPSEESPTSDESDGDTIQANNTEVLTNAKNEAHPGDPRKMMGKKTTVEAKNVNFKQFNVNYEAMEHTVDAYWEESDDESDFY